ncbi:MAG: sulfur oxidation c-type cytochrome SoxX [Acidithiobacillus sp.]|uniref:sulfur oxidation c-type cytochrome SoxX n=1 Tax=Acidithiobacillus sp. TaxID=1872118 RepID=UPI003D05CBC4
MIKLRALGWGQVLALGCLTVMGTGLADAAGIPPINAANIAAGRTIAFNKAQGNCLACHVLPGGVQAGNVGPNLSELPIHVIFKNREKLAKFIYDPEKVIPHINMPRFGKDKVLTNHQIGLVTDYLWSLK